MALSPSWRSSQKAACRDRYCAARLMLTGSVAAKCSRLLSHSRCFQVRSSQWQQCTRCPASLGRCLLSSGQKARVDPSLSCEPRCLHSPEPEKGVTMLAEMQDGQEGPAGAGRLTRMERLCKARGDCIERRKASEGRNAVTEGFHHFKQGKKIKTSARGRKSAENRQEAC